MTEIVRVVCTIDGYEDLWIEYDVADWGLGVYTFLHADITIPKVVTEFIPEHSVAWHIRNTDGSVVRHPGAGANEARWRTIWDAFDTPTSRALFPWLWVSALMALQESMSLSPKSADNGTGDRAGTEELVDGREGDSAE
jgi:hypothetical protein